MRTLSLFRHSPFHDLTELQREVDRLFTSFNSHELPAVTPISGPAFTPSCDIEETETHYLLSFDLPGVKKEDIKVGVRNGLLTVSGERKEEREEKEKARYRSERFYGSFERSFQLPVEVKADQIEAKYEDGVLRLAVPRTEEARAEQVKIGEGKPGFWDRLKPKKGDGKSSEKRPAERVA